MVRPLVHIKLAEIVPIIHIFFKRYKYIKNGPNSTMSLYIFYYFVKVYHRTVYGSILSAYFTISQNGATYTQHFFKTQASYKMVSILWCLCMFFHDVMILNKLSHVMIYWLPSFKWILNFLHNLKFWFPNCQR